MTLTIGNNDEEDTVDNNIKVEVGVELWAELDIENQDNNDTILSYINI